MPEFAPMPEPPAPWYYDETNDAVLDDRVLYDSRREWQPREGQAIRMPSVIWPPDDTDYLSFRKYVPGERFDDAPSSPHGWWDWEYMPERWSPDSGRLYNEERWDMPDPTAYHNSWQQAQAIMRNVL